MKSITIRKRILYLLLAAALLLCTACTAGTGTDDGNEGFYYYPASAESETETVEQKENRDLFLITSIDYAEETIQMYRYADGRRYQYAYGLDTRFLDKYGNLSSAVQFVPGKAVYPGRVDTQGKLVTLQIADDVWEYDNVRRFSVDEERGVFCIADTNYSYDDALFVFSDGEQGRLRDLTANDRLTVLGQEKRILAVIVTTGHGTLQLTETTLFEGSYLQLDTSVFALITPEMEMELPEGTYTLTVANDGWGGSCTIEITRGETTTVDLDSIKGSGPQYGTILFSIDVEGAKLSIDGETIDYSSTVELRYGWHTMEVTASGYDDWSKYLYVNSAEATIVIELADGEADTSDTTVTTGDTTDEEAGEAEESGADQEEETSEDSSGDTDVDDLLEDYVSTLTEMLSK
jgi:hypothetical protein